MSLSKSSATLHQGFAAPSSGAASARSPLCPQRMPARGLACLLLSATLLGACGNKAEDKGMSAGHSGNAGKDGATSASAKDASSASAAKAAGAPATGTAGASAAGASAKGAKPALTVQLASTRSMELNKALAANGIVAPWQEASIGAEVGGLKLSAVNVNIGDVVSKGQVLATLSPASVQIDLMNFKAQVAEAEATLADAHSNAERARQLDQTGAISAQQIAQFITAEKTARARLDASKARLAAEQLRMSNTRVVASDAGIISSRTATLGAVVQPGQELFRLIRQGRLEWRGEVTGAELSQVRVGQSVALSAPDGSAVKGRVRIVSPVVDAQTRNALVYVDVPAGSSLKGGMLVKGEFDLGRATAITVPQTALLRRDGFSYLYVLEGADRVRLVKVETGQRSADRIEILKGLQANARFVVAGVGFLADGDLVRVQEQAQ